MPLSHQANLARASDVMRKLDEMCVAAAKLRRRIQRDMRAMHARDQGTFVDDPTVIAARKRRKTP